MAGTYESDLMVCYYLEPRAQFDLMGTGGPSEQLSDISSVVPPCDIQVIGYQTRPSFMLLLRCSTSLRMMLEGTEIAYTYSYVYMYESRIVLVLVRVHVYSTYHTILAQYD